MDKISYSFRTLATWIIGLHLGIQIVLFLGSLGGVSPELEHMGALSQFILSLTATLALWSTRKTTPAVIGPWSFAFRTGALWCLSNCFGVLSHWGVALKYEPIAFIASEITGAVFSIILFSIIGLMTSTRTGLAPSIARIPAVLLGLAFISELSAAMFWTTPATWFFVFLSITEAASAILVIWMLSQWRTKSGRFRES